MLHSFYTEIEKILKLIALDLDKKIRFVRILVFGSPGRIRTRDALANSRLDGLG
jgi:hypothetical protein